MTEFTHDGQAKHVYTVMEPYFTFHALVKPADAGKYTNERLHSLDIPLQINFVATKLQKTQRCAVFIILLETHKKFVAYNWKQ